MHIWRVSLFLIVLLVNAACAQVRHAFVIGNDSYPGNELKNARNDATSIYDSLKSVGYESTLVLDANRATLASKIDGFVETLKPGDTALIYYAGHGLQVSGENYLVPTDFRVTTPEAVRDAGYSLSSILERLTSHGATTQIVILDSCRDNPFLGSRSTKGGWAAFGTSAGSFLAFGTSPGSTASDDPKGIHGLFTKDLLPLLTQSNLDIEEMFRQVREAVIKDSNGQQVPWVASSLVGTYHVRPELDSKGRVWVSPNEMQQDKMSVASRTLTTSSATGSGPLPQDPSLLDGEIAHAISLAQDRQFEPAISVLQHALTIAPGSSMALRLLGLLLHKAGRDEEAVATFSRSLTYNNDAQLAAYRCAAEGLAGDPNTENDCATAVASNPSGETYLTLAAALGLKGEDQEAYTALNQSIALHPSDLAYALLGQFESKQGLQGAAQRSFSRASQLTISNPQQ